MDEATAAIIGGSNGKHLNPKHPRIQIMTIEELLAGQRIDMPAHRDLNVTFKRAKRVKKEPGGQQGKLQL